MVTGLFSVESRRVRVDKAQSMKRFLVPALLMAATVLASDIPDRVTPLTRLTPFKSSVSNETATATSHSPVDVPAKSTAVFQTSIVAANAGTENVVFSFRTSLDGANWTTTFPHTATVAANGTNPVTAIVSIGTNVLGRFISLDKIATTQTNAVTVSAASITFLPAP
jgi:hypothetical protein